MCICIGIIDIHAQVSIGNTNPQAAFEVESISSGILIPRVTLTATNVQAPVVNPQVERFKKAPLCTIQIRLEHHQITCTLGTTIGRITNGIDLPTIKKTTGYFLLLMKVLQVPHLLMFRICRLRLQRSVMR